MNTNLAYRYDSEAGSVSGLRPSIGRKLSAPTKVMDLVCFSHLRWDFVFQRPQHLLSRFAKGQRVFFIEEAVREAGAVTPHLRSRLLDGVHVVTPYLPLTLEEDEISVHRRLLNKLFAARDIRNFVAWYYTPMALKYSDHLKPEAIVYDCMDELTGFRGAAPELAILEGQLFSKANVVFTGGVTLYQAKKHLHRNIHAVPSSVDIPHFRSARGALKEPTDQKNIGAPKLGFYGVLDERFDLELLRQVAELRPKWNFVMIGPVCKISPSDLPRRSNIFYLGKKEYSDLPRYLSGWNVALMPFARNEATKFISPTKTPEYLAAGIPVVSTSIQDVVHPYGAGGMVQIADDPESFIAACERALSNGKNPQWLKRVDEHLALLSWDNTWRRMRAEIELVLPEKAGVLLKSPHHHAET